MEKETNLWKQLKRPIIALAPMADVTDAAFRSIIAKYGKPDVMVTEFTSVDGLCSVGQKKLLVNFRYTEQERPIVAQIFGSNPENFYKTALLIQELGFDGIDINMGCPVNTIVRQGGGAALMKDKELAQKIIAETKRGAGKLPVSVKTRLGYNTIDLNWIRAILDSRPAALTVHLRTRKEMSDVPARWDAMPDILSLRNELFGDSKKRPLILGNGDVKNVTEACEKVTKYGCDGVMLGRAIFGNPWLFARIGRNASSGLRPDSPRFSRGIPPVPSLEEKLGVMLEHTALFEKLFAGIKNFDIMKKHYKAYVSGFDGAKELRGQLMNCKNAEEVKNVVLTAYPETIFA
ncbi:tRNA-dihydrouridine synthase, partial [Candidatus Uhrbacteria bacterium]|nr:tRNA-dihydrouridine synthase [Candidatus Uhrbacteria bacterium]